MRRISVSIAVLLLTVWGGCGGGKERAVLATVGQHVITVEGLQTFVDGLLPGLKTKKEGMEAKRDYLQTMIDRELLLVEAVARGLDEAPEVVESFKRVERRILARTYEYKEIDSKIEITEEEIRRYFEDEGLHRQLRFSYIRVRTKEEAEEIAKEIREGRPFEDLARDRSLDMATGPRGGDLGFLTQELARSKLIPGDRFTSMQVGDVSEPYKTKFGYRFIKATEERPADLESQRGGIVRALRNRKVSDRKAELGEELGARFKLTLHPEGLRLLSNIRGGNLSEEFQGTPLYTFEGGEVTVGDYIYTSFRSMRRPVVGDSANVVRSARQMILPEVLMAEAARRAGLHQEAETISRLKKKEEEAFIEALRKIELKDVAAVSEEEIRAFYDEHPELFTLRPEATIREILVRTEEEARRLLDEARGGADMEKLAEQHTLRRTRWGKGEIRISLGMDEMRYGPVAEDCRNAQIGELRGPIQVEGFYSIYTVLGRKGERLEPFETAKRRARGYLRIRREKELFAGLLNRLREKYNSDVVVYEGNLKDVSIGA